MPRSRQSRANASPEAQPFGWALNDQSSVRPGNDAAFASAAPDESVFDCGLALAEFADAFVFAGPLGGALRPERGPAYDADNLSTAAANHPQSETGPIGLTDEFGAATVGLALRLDDQASKAKSFETFSFAGWSAGTAPSQSLDELPLQYGAGFALQIEPFASGIHALDCAAGEGSRNGFEAVAADAAAEPVPCVCCAFTFDSGGPLQETGDYNLSGTKWGSSGALGTPGGTVTWSIAGAGWTNQTGVGFFSGSTVSLSSVFNFDYVSVFTQAFAAWSAVADINFVQVADGGGHFGVGSGAYIRICAGFIDGNYGVLARAFYPATAGNPQNYAHSGDMVFDSGETSFWTASSLLAVATHEIGHAIGLGHSSVNNSIMAPTYNASIKTPQADDIAGARAIYGAAPASAPSDDYADHRHDTTAPFGQVAAGGSSTGNLEAAGDRDWFRITLTAGITYAFELKGAASGNGTLADPYLYLYSSAGNLIAFDDDGGSLQDSRIVYTAAASGTYYLGAAAYDDAGTGTYRLFASATSETVDGDDSDDTFVATAMSEIFMGFGGSDTVSYAGQTGPAGVIVNLAAPKSNTGFAAGDTYFSIENLIGTSQNDRLTGDAGDNILEGGIGADRLDGGAGFDTASYLGAASGVTVNLTKPKLNAGEAAGDTYNSIERIFGSQFDDILTGGKGIEAVMGGAGDDIISGGAKIDELTGGSGRDTFLFANIKEAGDVITDFTAADDLIGIVRKGFKINALVDHGAGGLHDFANEYFVSNATGLATALGHGQFVYNQTTDQLLWDPDGAGKKAAVVIARFATDVDLTAQHFVLI
ncbi:matrixin family metalloprotease [Pseudorhodoplanes sp.]|uniref:matrixin family metalloprotease n=1 Tax=Pseudorhodoplanes sp. TaxID=1934341 RepID=UPI00391BB854